MDEQLAKWQRSFQQATPNVDAQALLNQVKQARKKEMLKRWLDIVLSVCVTIFCVFTALIYAESTMSKALFLFLAPVPIGFAIWAFRQSLNNKLTDQLDIQCLLAHKRQKLNAQLRYWKVSVWLMSVLFLGVVILFVANMSDPALSATWGTIAFVQTPIIGFTYWKFFLLKRALPVALMKIENIQDQ